YLRRGVRWHDGKPFGADDVLFTFEKLRDPTSKTIAIRSYLDPIDRIEKIDDYTVRFHLGERYWFAFDAIAEIFIYPKHIYSKGDFNTHPANRSPVGTGRFAFAHWKTGDEIALKRNDDYWGPKAHLDRMVFKYVPDPTVRTQLLLRGDIDVVEKLSPAEWRARTESEEIAQRFWRLRHVPASLQWIGWNEDRPMFADRRVRQAMTMLIDRNDIVDNLRLGLDTLAVSWFYPGTKEFDAGITPLPYDPDEASDLLEAAGWEDHDGDGIRDRDGKPFAFTFLYPAGPPFYEQLASLLEADFRKAGIEVQSARLEWAVYTERLRKHEFDVCSLLWQMSPRNDPYQVWHSSGVNGGSNFISFRNAEVDRILEEARVEFDEPKRVALYRQFNRILHREQPYTMLFNRYNLSFVSKAFGGIVSTPYGVLTYADFYVRDQGK
ncbi:MAG: ABC transporter substrate-binding protein, partial [Myxococcota bacterium]